MSDTEYEFRTARPEDAAAVEALDGSFTTRTVFHVAVTENGFALREVPVDPPLRKVFPAEETGAADAPGAEEDTDSRTFVAVATDGNLAGFATVGYAAWNRRLGFTFCGLDTALYDGTPSAGEQALYMSMPCR
ncbi:hypothetical protein HZZ00_20690 [Streptomyces sp. NEAU-sy36]|uniref:hypothetical protein n=1 Tax=unclassified Streptomyces TaxID=2593676 RepID=UPI0015D65B0F|nr:MULTISPECIES: hypothetical protein [unclassified Streptomyces]QLJ03157.1 hypothetical protein HZZ00_20690 [Streptomyces sp. NEAU-sy36]